MLEIQSLTTRSYHHCQVYVYPQSNPKSCTRSDNLTSMLKRGQNLRERLQLDRRGQNLKERLDKRGKNFKATIQNFRSDVESNGIRGAIHIRRARDGREDVPCSGRSPLSRSPASETSGHGDESDDVSYTLGDHMEYLHIRQDLGGHYYTDATYMLSDSSVSNLIHDFCTPIPVERLQTLYMGFQDIQKPKTSSETLESLPVRTMSFRLRPDVMTAVVLDAIKEACEIQPDTSVQVLRRLQGHLRCLLLSTCEGANDHSLILDATICTSRTGVLERQLILRVFHAEEFSPGHKRRSSRDQDDDLFKMVGANDLMVPVNLHLRGASSFLQYLSKQSCRPNPTTVACPKGSPKANSAYFLASYDPCFSVQMRNEVPHVPVNNIFPSLNSNDWALLQSSWTVISSAWRNLLEANCAFHSIVDIPLFDKNLNNEEAAVLDLHYCSQLRQVARDRMLAELESNFTDIKSNLDNMEKSYQNFVDMLKKTWLHYQMAQFRATVIPSPRLKMPSTIPPPGFMQLAEVACKCAEASSLNPEAKCDDAVSKVFKTFSSQDDHASRKHLKEANALVMERLVKIQETQIDLVQELETHQNAQSAAKQFCKSARAAINSKGRVERFILARVPVLDLTLSKGRCQITTTNMLCTNERAFDNKCYFFDLKAVDFQISSESCLAVITDDASREVLYKLHTVETDVRNLLEFLRTLQTLQGVFERKTMAIEPPEDDIPQPG